MTNSWRQIMVPSVTGALRKIHFDIERQQPIEQRRLAIIMPRLEAAVADLFAAVLQQTKPQQRPQDSAPPWRRPTCPKSPTEWQAPGWYTAASASRWFASRLRKPIATTAQCRCPPAAKSRAGRGRNTRDPCARTQDETGSPVSYLAAHRLASTFPRASPLTCRAVCARAGLPPRAT